MSCNSSFSIQILLEMLRSPARCSSSVHDSLAPEWKLSSLKLHKFTLMLEKTPIEILWQYRNERFCKFQFWLGREPGCMSLQAEFSWVQQNNWIQENKTVWVCRQQLSASKYYNTREPDRMSMQAAAECNKIIQYKRTSLYAWGMQAPVMCFKIHPDLRPVYTDLCILKFVQSSV